MNWRTRYFVCCASISSTMHMRLEVCPITGHLRILRYLAHTAAYRTSSHPKALWRYLPIALQCWREWYQCLLSAHDHEENDDESGCVLSLSVALDFVIYWWHSHYHSREALCSLWCHSLWEFVSSRGVVHIMHQQQCIRLQQWRVIHSSASLKTNIQEIVQESDMHQMWICDQLCHQPNQNRKNQQDQTLSLLDTINLTLGCEPNIEEFASLLCDAIPLVPLGIGHTFKC